MASKYSVSFSGVVIETTVADKGATVHEWVTQILQAKWGQDHRRARLRMEAYLFEYLQQQNSHASAMRRHKNAHCPAFFHRLHPPVSRGFPMSSQRYCCWG